MPAEAESRKRRENAKRKAAKLKEEERFEEAIIEYDKLIQELEPQAKVDARRNIELLKLRCHKGSCLCDWRRLKKADARKKAEEHQYTEAYIRETLRLWEQAEGKDCARGIADTSTELAYCLIRQLNNNEKLKMELDVSKAEEAAMLLGNALDFYEDPARSSTDDPHVLSILQNLSDTLVRLEEYESAKYFSRMGLWKIEDPPANSTLRRKKAALKHILANALFCQRRYEEAGKEYEDILRLLDHSEYSERDLVKPPEKYRQYILDCERGLDVQKKWDRAFFYALTLVSRRKEARQRWQNAIFVVRLTVKMAIICRQGRERNVHRSWRMLCCTAILVARLTRLKLKHHRARQRWRRVLALVCATVKLQLIGESGRERRIAASRNWKKALRYGKAAAYLKITLYDVRKRGIQRRWNIALSHARQQAKVNMQARRAREEMWHTTVAHIILRRKWHSVITCTLVVVRARAKARITLRKQRGQKMWHTALVTARVVATLSIAGKRHRARLEAQKRASDRWSQLYVWSRAITKILQRRPSPPEPSPPSLLPEVFFDAQSSQGHAQSDAWLQDYAAFCEHLVKHSKSQSSDYPVKVAIIDTGIDFSNDFIKSRWPPTAVLDGEQDTKTNQGLREKQISKYYRDFLDKPSPPDDNDGHGTHIAGILLRYAPLTHLYVARVADTRLSCKTDAGFEQRVVNAVKCALDEWKVDIISLSFAMHGRELRGKMDDLITQAFANKEKKTVIFAAACNEGGRRPVPYPANHHLVFTIHALTGYGKPAEFSPYGDPFKPNFSILGTDILSTWPTKLQDPNIVDLHAKTGPRVRNIDGVTCMTRYMSGTSFAAPLAAALVANVFAYYIEHRTQIVPKWDRSNAHLYRVQTFDGVRKVLLRMSSRRKEGYDIMPWSQENDFFSMYPRPPEVLDLNVAFRRAIQI